MSDIESVWEPAATSQLVVIQATERGKVVFIQLQAGKDESGDFYTVRTAFPSSRSYAEKRKEWKKLWSRVPVPATDAGAPASSAELGNEAGPKSAMESSQSTESSVPAQAAQAQPTPQQQEAAEQPQQADKQGESTDDRDTFTLTRLNRETNQMEPVTFKRGEYVRYMVGNQEQFGDIDGISQARREFSVDGLWYPMAFAYKAERPAAPERKDMVPMSKVIEKMNAKNGEGLTDADRVPEQKPASKTPTVDRHAALMQSVREGKATAEQFKAEFESLVANKDAVVADLALVSRLP